MTDVPSLAQLWEQAGGVSERYRELMRQHGYLLSPGDDGYEAAARQALPCGWSPRMRGALESLDKSPARRRAVEEERCEITDMIVSQCSHCTGRGEEKPAAPDPSGYGPWFAAHYAGKCGACGERFEAEDQIRADGDGGWLCANCGREEARP